MADARSARHRDRAAERGFVLVAVLWILAALATLASVYAIYVGRVAAASHVDEDRLRGRAAALSALELTAMRLSSTSPDNLPGGGAFAFRVDRSTVSVKFVNEAARVDLNVAPKGLLARLFASLGASADDAAGFADSVIAWRTGGDVAGHNAEAEVYKADHYGYAPRQAPFQDPLELRLVRGLPPALVDAALPYVTIFSGKAKVDARAADAFVLAALPKSTPDAVKSVLAQRAATPEDGETLVKMLGAAVTDAAPSGAPAVRVTIDINVDDGAVFHSEAVILMTDGDDDPYHVLYWRDASDGPL